ncbi:hypothetical protein ASE43_09765 [Lysobacter sp. Root983]|nr:hypothetical protein ASE43_09765 [Lysobacter sp. Root983]
MLRRLLGWFDREGADAAFRAALPPLEVSPELVAQAIEAFGHGDRAEAQIEAEVLRLAGHPLTARRLLDVIAEAFGLTLIAHIPECAGVVLPATFSARGRNGRWHTIECAREPIFALAAATAMRMLHDEGPSEAFNTIALRSASLTTVNRALHKGDSLDGGELSGPAFIGLPAELYVAP